jgi:hypothetical protein
MSDFLDQAVQAHVQWKLKLLSAISGHEKIDRATACVDDQCALGKWIYGEGRQFAALPEFAALQAKHKEFHDRVCAVANLIEAGKYDAAMAEVSHGAYKRASSETVDCIHRLKALRVIAA